MSELLLAILDEALDERAERMRAVQGAVEERQAGIRERQKDLEGAEHRKKCAVYEDEQATRRADVLREFLNRLEQQPGGLVTMLKRLEQEQRDKAKARREAEGQVDSIQHDLRSRQTHLAVAEKDYEEIREDRRVIAALRADLKSARE